MRFLLSIHDVWPGNFPLVAGYLQRLRSLGATRIAVLVVPCYHGQAPMERSEEFLAWLRAEAAIGTEIFLHGYRHWMPELAEGAAFRGTRTAWGRWINHKWVNGEAEFCGLSRPEQEKLLQLGAAAFRTGEVPCTGFVAPTWHGSPSMDALRGQGIGIRETRFHIRHLESGESRFAPPLAWDPSRKGGPALFGGTVWFEALLRLPLIKVAIHPGDFESSGTAPALERIFAKGRASGYADLFKKGAVVRGNAGVTSGTGVRNADFG